MKTKFTKGEWLCCDDDGEIWIDNANTGLVADLCTSDAGYIESLANANLIAAAPIGFNLGELVIKMCDHHKGLTADEVGILHVAATEFIKKCHGQQS